MKQLLACIIILHFSIIAVAQSDIKLPVPKTYKELQTSLNNDGKIALYDIQFEKDLIKLKKISEPQIKEISRLLNINKKMKIYIVVHSDNNCIPEDCIKISQKRAELIRDMLANDYMVNPEQIFPKGAGATAPLASNIFEEGKTLNRRVELVLQ